MHDVFISYSSKEFGAAQAVRVMLEEKGISCWMAPDSIPGGSNYTKEIPVAIRRCKVFVMILSENAQKSNWVLKELDSAVSHNKVILPFMLENFTLSDEFSFLLSGTQWYPAYIDADAELDKMVARIKSITAGTAPRKHPPRAVPRNPRPAPKSAPAPKAEPKQEPKAEPKAAVNTAPAVLCPACNGPAMEPLPYGKKSYSFTESLHFLFVPLLAIPAAVIAILLGLLLWNVTQFSPNAVPECLACGVILIPIGISLGTKIAKERIRRSRVRKHIRACGALCRCCAKKFRVAVPFGTLFPWEVPETL